MAVACTTAEDSVDLIDSEYDELSEEIDNELGEELDSEFDELGDEDFEGDGEYLEDDFADEDFEDSEFGDEDLDIAELDDSFDDEDLEDFEDEDFDDEDFDDDSFALDEDNFDDDFNDDFGSGSGRGGSGQSYELDQALANQLDNQNFNPPPAPSNIQGGGQSPIDTKIVEAPPSPLPNDDLGRPDPLVLESRGAQRPSWIPVKKIKTTPFKRSGDILNTVYIARPGDSLKSISGKIYGDKSKASLLEKNNSYLAGGVDPGDKVYYNSPNRPGDSVGPIKTFHEDQGLTPQIYTTKANDDMRRLGAKLLGFQAGWKEIWAINPNVASKSTLPPGIELRYWTGNESTGLADNSLDENPGGAFGADDEPEIDSFDEELESDLDPLDEVAAIEEEALPEPLVEELEEDFGDDLGDVEADESAFAAAPSGGDPNLGSGGSGSNGVGGAAGRTGGSQGASVKKSKGKSLLTTGAFGLGFIFLAALVAVAIKNRKEDEGLPPSMEYTQV